MSYLNAARKGSENKSPGSHSLPAPPPQAVVQEKNEPVETVVEEEVEEQVPEKTGENVQETFTPSTQVTTRVGNKKYTGGWAKLEFEDEEKENEYWRVFVVAAGPISLCNFALTCTYFFDKLLTPDMWALVQPSVLIPSIHLKIETSIESGSAEKTQTVPITSLKQNYQIIQLLTYWNRILTRAEEEREKTKNDSGDPTLGKEPLNATLNGGFAIETVSEKKNNSLCYLQDLKLVISVTNAVKQLIFRNSKSVKIPYRNGNITIALYGRGGTLVSFNVKAGKDNVRAIFPLDIFANQIRKAAKKFIPLAGSCRMQLQKQRNNIMPDNTNSFQEKEQWILKVLEHEALDQAVREIRNHLSHGGVPGSQLPEHFQKKSLQKDKKQSQLENENNNIMDLIVENLPPHFDDAKKAAVRLQTAAETQKDNEEKDRQARFDAKRQEREREKEEKKKLAEAEKQGKTLEEAKEEILAQVPKKPKTKKVTKTDKVTGFKNKIVVDAKTEEEIKKKDKPVEKKEVESTPEKVKSSSKKTASEHVDDSNVFSIADDFDDVPSPNDYQISLKETKQKGMEKSQANKKKYPNPAPKPDKKKEKAEKEKKEAIKKQKAPKPAPSKPIPPPVQSTEVPFFQNELVKPLVYVVALVSVLSVLYLIMS